MSAPDRLSPELLELLDAERDIDAPEPAVRERAYARLAPFLVPLAGGALVGHAAAAGTAASAGGVGHAAVGELATAAKAASVAGTVSAKLVLVSMVSALSGAVGGVAGHAYYAAARPAAVATVASRPTAPPVAVALAPSADREPVAAATSAAPSANVKLAEPPRSTASLRGERLLLERASVALMKGDPASALTALRQHSQRFPRGTLAQEREVLMVQALAASGNEAAAQDRAKDFKRKFPGSLQQDSVDKASKAQ